MRYREPSLSAGQERTGKTLVLFVLLAPVLVGMVGLVVDSGLLMASFRQAQNGADAAALAAAMELWRGANNSTAVATANGFMTGNGLSGVTLTLNGGASNALNIPPQGGAYAGAANFAQAVVTVQVNTLFIQVLTGKKTNQVTARAVAGFETIGAGEGAILLDQTAAPGLAVKDNNSRLIVNGTVVVNSKGTGYDQYGDQVASQYSQPAVQTGSTNIVPSPIVATYLQVAGGVDKIDNIRAYDPAFGPTYFYDPSNADRPVFARGPIALDPLASIPTPSTSNGVQAVYYQYSKGVWTSSTSPPAYDIKLGNGDSVTFNPGIYQSISITNNAVATFNPGIYVLQSGGMNINGGSVTGSGVMFYNQAGGISITGGQTTFTPYGGSSANDPFAGMLIYQDRSNTSPFKISGSSSQLNLKGTVYAKTAQGQISGSGKLNTQFIIGSMQISGGATVTINAGGKDFGKANLVFLVE